MKIEKNVPIPQRGLFHQRQSKYPFRNMEVGDSVYYAERAEAKLALASAYKHGRDKEWAFTGRFDPTGGCRIWRTA